MVKSDQKRQQKLARKQAKDRKRQKELVQKRQQLASLHGQMLTSAGGAIVYCGITDSIEGMQQVIFSRRAPNGLCAFFTLLVDTFCLGVKDVFGGLCASDQLRELCERTETNACSPELARGLVESAIRFAQLAGLQPHADYRHAALLWGDTPVGSIEGHYTLGYEGKHLYINGPFDDIAKQKLVLNALSQNLGEGNYALGMSSSPDYINHLIQPNLDDDDPYEIAYERLEP